MNRHYDTGEYAALCDKLRRIFAGCALTTDIMVGFPGETEEEFAQSLSFARRIGFARTHVFAYSRRPGTVADKMPDQIPASVKNERSRRMIAACRESSEAYIRGYIGKTVSVLLETKQPDGRTEGHTPDYVTVHVQTDRPSGTILNVYITGCQGEIALGTATT